MHNKFIAYVLGNKDDRQVVERLHTEIVRTSNEAIGQANALERTIKDMIERKRLLDRFKNEIPNKTN